MSETEILSKPPEGSISDTISKNKSYISELRKSGFEKLINSYASSHNDLLSDSTEELIAGIFPFDSTIRVGPCIFKVADAEGPTS